MSQKMDVVENKFKAFCITAEGLNGRVAVPLDDLENENDLSVANDWYAEQSYRISDFMKKRYIGLNMQKRLFRM